MTKEERNHRDYLKNKDRISAQRKAKRRRDKHAKMVSNVVSIFLGSKKRGDSSPILPVTLKQTAKKISLFWLLEVTFLQILVCAMTYYLIKEAAVFYLATEESSTSAYLKAFIGEGLILVFSFFRSPHLGFKILYKSTLVALCIYSVLALSGKIIRSSTQQHFEAEVTQKMIRELEAEIQEKSSLRAHYFELGWTGAALKYEKSIDVLRNKLQRTREAMIKMQSPNVIQGVTEILIFFRFLVMIGNILCVHRLSDMLRSKNRAATQAMVTN